MNSINKIFSIILSFVILLSFAGCGETEANTTKKTNFDSIKNVDRELSGMIAENSNFVLEWDNKRACIILTEKSTESVWSTIPYDYYLSGKTSGREAIMMGSPLMLSYFNISNNKAIKSVNGYTGIIKNGRISCKKIKDGVRVQYFFDKLKIMIPVDYVLRDNGILASVKLKDIVEEDNLVYKFSILPFFCSAVNSDNPDGQYIVVPSGSGALMYTYENEDGKGREYNESVYGDDPVCYKSEKLSNTETVRLPLFGAKDGNKAICGIIEEGSACGSIEALTGDAKIGYSAVYPTFTIRGSNISAIDFQGGNVTEVETFSKDLSGYEKVSVGYYPLTGDKSNYVGMASVYRELAKKPIKNSDGKSNDRLTVKLLGGLQTKDSILGIPYNKTVSATTFDEALNIVKQIKSITENGFDVVLSGFGETGLDVGNIAGGFAFADAVGSEEEFKKLNEYCRKNNIGLYIDFDIVRFNKSANGFSKTFDAAKASNSFTAYQYYYSVALRNTNEKYERYVLLNRKMINKAVDKLLGFTKHISASGVALSSLSNIAYSDYDSPENFVRGGTEQQIASIIQKIKAQNVRVMVSNANGYAAIFADKIIDAPVKSSMFDVLDCDVPLYQIAFKGVTGISSSSINTGATQRIQFLKALEGGSGIQFVLSGRYDTEFATTKHSGFSVALFSDNFASIENYVKESNEYYDLTEGTFITEHRIFDNNLRYTKFSNGTQIWINYGKNPITVDSVKIDAYGFMLKGAEK